MKISLLNSLSLPPNQPQGPTIDALNDASNYFDKKININTSTLYTRPSKSEPSNVDNGIPRFQVPRQCRHWLFDTGSLTKRLQEISDFHFNVHVLQQYQGKASLAEQQALNLRPRARPFVREVELLCNNLPWVFARTVIPPSTLTGEAKLLTRLGNKPLGAALFSSPFVSRGAIIVKRIHSSTLSLSHPIPPQWLWGRHSIFFIHQAPLLVNEIFLPNSPLYSR